MNFVFSSDVIMTFEATEEPGRLICDGSEHKISDF